MPVLLLIGSAGLAVLGGISIVVAMKAFDGEAVARINKLGRQARARIEGMLPIPPCT